MAPLQHQAATARVLHIDASDCPTCADSFRAVAEQINTRLGRTVITYFDLPFSVATETEYAAGIVNVSFPPSIEALGEDTYGIASLNCRSCEIRVVSGLSKDEMQTVSLHELGHVFGLNHSDRGIMCGGEGAACPYADEMRANGEFDSDIAEFMDQLK